MESRPPSRPERRPATLKDVANAAGLAPITVSRALRGSSVVTAETRSRIEAIAKQLGYVPNQVASSLKSQRTGLVAVIVPTVSGSVFSETIESISATLHAAGYQFMIGESSYNVEREQEVLRALMRRRPDGAIIVGVNHTAATRDLLRSLHIPVVEIWDLTEDPVDSVVGFSNRHAADDFTAQLIGRGYRRFAMASGPMDHFNRASRRAEGHRAALTDAGLEIGPAIVIPHFLGFLESGATLVDFIRGTPDIDCLFCTSELIAIGAVVQCRRRNIQIPRDIAIVGFGDVEAATIIEPPLTTVKIRGVEMGRQAAEHLCARLGGSQQTPVVVDVGYDIMWRATA